MTHSQGNSRTQAKVPSKVFECHESGGQEEVVRVAEATQSLLSEDSSNPAGLLQKAEDVSTGQVRRLLDAAMRQRPASAAEGDGAPGLPVSA